MLWTCREHVVNMLWTCGENGVDMWWICCEHVVNMLWTCCEHVNMSWTFRWTCREHFVNMLWKNLTVRDGHSDGQKDKVIYIAACYAHKKINAKEKILNINLSDIMIEYDVCVHACVCVWNCPIPFFSSVRPFTHPQQDLKGQERVGKDRKGEEKKEERQEIQALTSPS